MSQESSRMRGSSDSLTGITMNILKYLVLLCGATVLVACGSVDIRPTGKDGAALPEPSATQLAGDMPIPAGASVRPPETLVMGTGNRWMGRISLNVSGDSQIVYAFFRDNLPSAGWVLTSSSYSKLSFLTFSKAERVATIQIQSSSFSGNEVTITVTPATKPANTTP
jgi:hypothetical protein